MKLWLTFNEPWVTTWLGYGIDVFAPGIYSPATGTYVVTHHIIKSHAEAWHTYDRQFRPTQNGAIDVQELLIDVALSLLNEVLQLLLWLM